MVVPASLWPSYDCEELGGAGWEATVKRVISSDAVRVSFTNAKTRDGAPYADEALEVEHLREISK